MGGFFSSLTDQGLMQIGFFINWPYLITFMVLTWMINKIIKSRSILPKVKPKIKTIYRSMIVGFVLAIIFFFGNEEYTAREVLRYFVSMTLAQFVLWGGIKSVVPTIAKNYKDLVDPFRRERRGRDYKHHHDHNGEYGRGLENYNDNGE